MKNTLKLIGIIAIMAIIGLSMVTCGDPGGSGGGGGVRPTPAPQQTSITYTSMDPLTGAMYSLKISRPGSASVLSSQSVSAQQSNDIPEPNANIASASSAGTAFTPRAGDIFILTRTLGIYIETTTGTVSIVSGGNFTLQPQGSSAPFTLVVNLSTGIINAIPSGIPLDVGGFMISAVNLGALRPIFIDAQVYTFDNSQRIFSELKETDVVYSNPDVGVGTILDGLFTFIPVSAPAPSTLKPFADDIGWGDFGTVNPTNARAVDLDLHRLIWDFYEEPLFFYDFVITGNNYSIEHIAFLYVDRNCIVTIPAGFNNYTSWHAATLQLKQGWNMISIKVSGTVGAQTNTRVFSVVDVLPPLKWVMKPWLVTSF